MDDKWDEDINWEDGIIYVDMQKIYEIKRAAAKLSFEAEEQQEAAAAFIAEMPEEAFRLATGYDPAEVSEGLNRIITGVGIAFKEVSEALAAFFWNICRPDVESLSDIMAKLQENYHEIIIDDSRRQRWCKQYRCTQHRKQNIRAFQNIPCGYIAPMTQRNNRVMIRRTI